MTRRTPHASGALFGSVAIGALLLGGAFADARADEKPRPLRATATVEVIEDARQVDDIIARVKSQGSDPAPKSEGQAARGPRRELDRVPVAPQHERDDKARERAQRQHDHHDRPARNRR
jgi:hypothetical protein